MNAIRQLRRDDQWNGYIFSLAIAGVVILQYLWTP